MIGFRRVRQRVLHRWHVWSLIEADCESPTGEQFIRTFVSSPGAVSIVAVDVHKQVLLIRQYRATVDRVVWEIPAGMRDKLDEDPAVCGVRELEEETGYTADRVDLLTVFNPSAGIMDASHHVYLARDLRFVGTRLEGPEEAHLEVHWVALDEAVALVERGEIMASSAVIGLLLAARRLAS